MLFLAPLEGGLWGWAGHLGAHPRVPPPPSGVSWASGSYISCGWSLEVYQARAGGWVPATLQRRSFQEGGGEGENPPKKRERRKEGEEEGGKRRKGEWEEGSGRPEETSGPSVY